MNQKIPFHQLSARIASATGISEDSAEIFAKNFFDILSEELIKGETVKIKGLGEFALYEEENGEKDIRFTPDKDLAETLNAPFAMFEPVTLNDEVTESMLSIEKDQTEASLPEAENPGLRPRRRQLSVKISQQQSSPQPKHPQRLYIRKSIRNHLSLKLKSTPNRQPFQQSKSRLSRKKPFSCPSPQHRPRLR